MHATVWLASLPLWLKAILIVGIPTAVAMAVSACMRHVVTLDSLTSNNEVAGFKFAVLGVMYAVLLGFVISSRWDKLHDTEITVAQEASDVVALYRLSDGLPPGDRQAVRDALTAYLHATIEQDWPAMAQGVSNESGTYALNHLYDLILADQPSAGASDALFSAMLSQLNALTEAREICFALALGGIPGVIWGVLLIGACVTVGFSFFFGAESKRAQVLMTGLLTLVVFMGLSVVVSISHPFIGVMSVSSGPLVHALRVFGVSGP